MIFISHTKKDKPLIEPIAQKLSKIYGEEKVFYDSWSIQPGDGIIDEINKGLKTCKFFFFFVSQNSLSSKMVDLEWQNALMKATKEEVKIIPIKIDDCQMPPVLLQNLYIDFVNYGPDEALRQMIAVINGERVHQSSISQKFHNVKAHISLGQDKSIIVEFRAEYYMEPHSRYMILVNNKAEDLEYKAVGESSYESNFFNDIQLTNGEKSNTVFIARNAATSPGFPFIVEIKAKGKEVPHILGAMRAISRKAFESIPTMFDDPNVFSGLISI